MFLFKQFLCSMLSDASIKLNLIYIEIMESIKFSTIFDTPEIKTETKHSVNLI